VLKWTDYVYILISFSSNRTETITEFVIPLTESTYNSSQLEPNTTKKIPPHRQFYPFTNYQFDSFEHFEKKDMTVKARFNRSMKLILKNRQHGLKPNSWDFLQECNLFFPFGGAPVKNLIKRAIMFFDGYIPYFVEFCTKSNYDELFNNYLINTESGQYLVLQAIKQILPNKKAKKNQFKVFLNELFSSKWSYWKQLYAKDTALISLQKLSKFLISIKPMDNFSGLLTASDLEIMNPMWNVLFQKINVKFQRVKIEGQKQGCYITDTKPIFTTFRSILFEKQKIGSTLYVRFIWDLCGKTKRLHTSLHFIGTHHQSQTRDSVITLGEKHQQLMI